MDIGKKLITPMHRNSANIQEHQISTRMHSRIMKNPSLPTKVHEFQSYLKLESTYVSHLRVKIKSKAKKIKLTSKRVGIEKYIETNWWLEKFRR